MDNLIEAKNWEVIEYEGSRQIQLYDSKGFKIEGYESYWEGNFDCSGLFIDSLEGSPAKIKGNFICRNNRIKDLIGAPNEIFGDFDCSGNSLLETLGELPKLHGRLIYENLNTGDRNKIKESISEALEEYNKQNSYGKYL